jgi:hypothetical protein
MSTTDQTQLFEPFQKETFWKNSRARRVILLAQSRFTTNNLEKNKLHFNDHWVADNGPGHIWPVEQLN